MVYHARAHPTSTIYDTSFSLFPSAAQSLILAKLSVIKYSLKSEMIRANSHILSLIVPATTGTEFPLYLLSFFLLSSETVLYGAVSCQSLVITAGIFPRLFLVCHPSATEAGAYLLVLVGFSWLVMRAGSEAKGRCWAQGVGSGFALFCLFRSFVPVACWLFFSSFLFFSSPLAFGAIWFYRLCTSTSSSSHFLFLYFFIFYRRFCCLPMIPPFLAFSSSFLPLSAIALRIYPGHLSLPTPRDWATDRLGRNSLTDSPYHKPPKTQNKNNQMTLTKCR